jgi:hypothetical protein
MGRFGRVDHPDDLQLDLGRQLVEQPAMKPSSDIDMKSTDADTSSS